VVGGSLEERIAVLRTEPLGDRHEVVARVSPFGQRYVAPTRLLIARPRRLAEQAHLPPEVVDVILALDIPARRLEEARRHVAEDGATPVADVQRSGRVGAHELDLHLPSLAGVGPAV